MFRTFILITFLFYFVNSFSHMCNVLTPFPANCTELTTENVRVCYVYDYKGNEIFYGNVIKNNIINCITSE